MPHFPIVTQRERLTLSEVKSRSELPSVLKIKLQERILNNYKLHYNSLFALLYGGCLFRSSKIEKAEFLWTVMVPTDEGSVVKEKKKSKMKQIPREQA